MHDRLCLYLDQMIQRHVCDVLNAAGYDAVRASEYGQSRADDNEILEKAILEKRILITLDDHFGDWAVLPWFKEAVPMRIQYSQEADVLVFIFKNGQPVDSIDMKEGIILHLDNTGAPLEMEILDASKYVSMDEFNIVMPMSKGKTMPIHA